MGGNGLPAPPSDDAGDFSERERVDPPGRRVLAVVGTILAPTTVVTALLFYFGMLHAHWFFAFFGVNYTVLELSPQDFLIRSADGLFVPLTVAAAAVLVGILLFRVLAPVVPDVTRRVISCAAGPAAAIGGIGLVGIAAWAVVNPSAFAATLGLPGLCLALGVLLLAAVPHLRRRPGSVHSIPVAGVLAVAEWAAVFLLTNVGLFWAAGDYSAAVGTGRGYAVQAGLASSPRVVLYSEKDLGLQQPGVIETDCTRDGQAYGFRYTGLALVMQAGDRYVFLPRNWTPTSGTAFVVPRSDTLRLEFAAPEAEQAPDC